MVEVANGCQVREGAIAKGDDSSPRLIGVFDVFDSRRPRLAPNDRHQIKSHGVIVPTAPANKVPRGPFDPPPFFGPNRLEGILMLVVRSGLDLDEDDHVAFDGDQIELAHRAAEIPNQHPMASPLQRPSRHPFAAGAEDRPRITRC